MKKLILLLLFLFNFLVGASTTPDKSSKPENVQIVVTQESYFNDVFKDQNQYSFFLLLTDKENNKKISQVSVNELKKCEFPTGPVRNNNISLEFTTINELVINKIDFLISQKQCFELSSFCIDAAKYKTWAFELPGKKDLCYVFKLDKESNETRGFIISNILMNELIKLNEESDDDIDIATKDSEPSAIEEKVEQPSCYLKDLANKIKDSTLTRLQEIGCFVFMKYIDLKQYLTKPKTVK